MTIRWNIFHMIKEEEQVYLDSLQVGEEVVETTRSSCMYGMHGTIYISQNESVTFGYKCVMWENGMGTSVTHGTRRIRDT